MLLRAVDDNFRHTGCKERRPSLRPGMAQEPSNASSLLDFSATGPRDVRWQSNADTLPEQDLKSSVNSPLSCRFPIQQLMLIRIN